MKKNRNPLSILAVAGWLALCPAEPALFAANWNGGSDTNWFNPANWTPAAVPGTGAEVTITNGNVTLTNSTAVLGSLTISNAPMTFTGWNSALQAGAVNVLATGKLTHTACDTNTTASITSRVYVVCGDFTVATNGSVDANGRGFRGSQGEGRGADGTSGGGGGYGGAGGNGNGTTGGSIYGGPEDAAAPGSGGGSGTSTTVGVGGAGGGAIWIEATGTVQLHGSILAKGTKTTGTTAGAGSGGGITLICHTFEGGSGSLVDASGGLLAANTTEKGSAGGGGRIVLVAQSVTSPVNKLLAAKGTKSTSSWSNPGNLGTIHLSHGAFLPETGRVDGIVYNVSTWSPASLIWTQAEATLAEPDLAFTVAGNMTLNGSTLDISLSNTLFDVQGDLLLTNNTQLTIRNHGATNTVAPYLEYGALAQVGGTLTVAAGSTNAIAPRRDDTGPLKLTARTLHLAGTVHSDGLGGAGGDAYADDTDGQGEGGGAGGGQYGAGGGHGGVGANFSAFLGGGIYGYSNAPVRSGSGGGARAYPTGGSPQYQHGGSGGGLVWIVARHLTVATTGRISANGNAGGGFTGGGSGGSVYLRANNFTNEGDIQAIGGGGGAAGGGGRIAAWAGTFILDDEANYTVAAGGAGAGAGTVVRGTIKQIGTVISFQ